MGNGQKVIKLTKDAAQWYVRNYQGKDGIRVSQNKKYNSTLLLNTKVLPSKIIFSFTIGKNENATLSLYNKKSNLIKSVNLTSKDENYILDTTNLSSGLYLYKLESPTYSKTKKIMVFK